jgi:hypothetical protein
LLVGLAGAVIGDASSVAKLPADASAAAFEITKLASWVGSRGEQAPKLMECAKHMICLAKCHALFNQLQNEATFMTQPLPSDIEIKDLAVASEYVKDLDGIVVAALLNDQDKATCILQWAKSYGTLVDAWKTTHLDHLLASLAGPRGKFVAALDAFGESLDSALAKKVNATMDKVRLIKDALETALELFKISKPSVYHDECSKLVVDFQRAGDLTVAWGAKSIMKRKNIAETEAGADNRKKLKSMYFDYLKERIDAGEAAQIPGLTIKDPFARVWMCREYY